MVMSFTRRTLKQHLQGAGPKRILALDGGGLRGILTLGILESVERELRQRHGNDESFRLSDYFDLIAGTSTGAIIAATLALGWSVKDIKDKYFELGKRVFKRSLLRQGLFRAKYDEVRLIEELKAVYGADTTLGSDRLLTGLLVVIKRIDSGSPWPVSNNPNGKYFCSRPGGTIGNGDYKLWSAVRASTAAPDYFDPERITIAQLPDHPPIYGDFVDGGVSPFNNPALQAFMYATLSGYRLKWRTGEKDILLVSVGTGSGDTSVRHSQIAAAGAFQSLLALMDDSASLQETMLQWMSQSPTARRIDSELQALEGDLIGGTPQLTYVRYDADLRPGALQELIGERAATLPVENLTAMDAPENMEALHLVGTAFGEARVKDEHFPADFDLGDMMTDTSRQRYVRRPDRPVAAVRLALDTNGLVYHKWGDDQRAMAGDWVVDNDGDVYTVNAEVFARTYRQTGPGTYVKSTPVWAQRASQAGSVKTKEGVTHYEAGDYLVSNNQDGSDEYAMTTAKFENLYKLAKN
jgi:predicted acylesterase/phospholipase RssA